MGVGSVRREVHAAICAISFPILLTTYLVLSFVVVALEEADHYVEAAAATVVAVPVLVYVIVLPGMAGSALRSGGQPAARSIGQGHWTPPNLSSRGGCASGETTLFRPPCCGFDVGNGRLVQYGVLGAVIGIAVQLISAHSFVFAVVIGGALTLGFGVPLAVGAAFAPSLQPILDLGQGTKRVAAGDYSQRLPVVQDDDLGALAASFNRMQAGLAERQRLQAAFGTYVDPALPARLGSASGSTPVW